MIVPKSRGDLKESHSMIRYIGYIKSVFNGLREDTFHSPSKGFTKRSFIKQASLGNR